jgi:hypothetical protein
MMAPIRRPSEQQAGEGNADDKRGAIAKIE